MITIINGDILQAVLAAPPATIQPQAIVSFSNKTAAGYSPGRQLTVLTGVTDVAILATPAAGSINDVDLVNILNRDTAAVTLTVKIDVAGVDSSLITVTLQTLETLTYTHSDGWSVITATGESKLTATQTLTGDVTGTGSGSIATTIAPNAVDNTKLADMATQTIKGRSAAGTGDPQDLTTAQVAALFTSPTVQVLTSGTATYTTPAGCRYIEVEALGGGGGGTGSGTSPGNGGVGGTTFFSSMSIAGGNGGVAAFGNVGGIASGGDINIQGGSGQSGLTTPAIPSPGGAGGNSAFGGGARGSNGSAGDSAPVNTGGGGGGGGVSATAQGGGGGGAGGYSKKIIVNPAASYAYVVGASGAGGTAGTGGFAGGNGGSGIIIVTEHYI